MGRTISFLLPSHIFIPRPRRTASQQFGFGLTSRTLLVRCFSKSFQRLLAIAQKHLKFLRFEKLRPLASGRKFMIEFACLQISAVKRTIGHHYLKCATNKKCPTTVPSFYPALCLAWARASLYACMIDNAAGETIGNGSSPWEKDRWVAL